MDDYSTAEDGDDKEDEDMDEDEGFFGNSYAYGAENME